MALLPKINNRVGWNNRVGRKTIENLIDAGWHKSESKTFICGKMHEIVKENTKSSKIEVNSSTFYSKLISICIIRIMQDGIIVLVGIFFQKLINVQDGIRACRLDFFQKRIRFAARLLDTLK